MGQKRSAADALESIMAELESGPTATTFTVVPGSKKHTGEAERAAQGEDKTAKNAQRKRSVQALFLVPPDTAETPPSVPIAKLENDLRQSRTGHLGTSTATLINAPSEQSFSQSGVHQAHNPQLAACSLRAARGRTRPSGAIVRQM